MKDFIEKMKALIEMQERYEFLTSDNGCHLDWSITGNACRIMQWNQSYTAAEGITEWHKTPEAAIDEAIRVLLNQKIFRARRREQLKKLRGGS